MPIILPAIGYRPKLAIVNNNRATHLIVHSDTPSKTISYWRLTPAAPRGDLHHDLETGSTHKARGRIVATSDSPASPDPEKDHVFVVWADMESVGKTRLTVAMSHDGGRNFAIKPLTAPFKIISNIVVKAQGKHVYIAWDGDRTPGTADPRGVWFAATHDLGHNWKVSRLPCNQSMVLFGEEYGDSEDPHEIDMAVARLGKVIVVVFPYVVDLTVNGLTGQQSGVMSVVSKNYGQSFECIEVQPPREVQRIRDVDMFYRPRVVFDDLPVINVAWQWSPGMLLYRKMTVDQPIRIIPPVDTLAFLHPLEAILNKGVAPEFMPVGVTIVHGGTLEAFAMAASKNVCAFAYRQNQATEMPDLPAGLLPILRHPDTLEAFKVGHKVSVFGREGMFSLPLHAAGDQYLDKPLLSENALVPLIGTSKPLFATVGLEKRLATHPAESQGSDVIACVFTPDKTGTQNVLNLPSAPVIVSRERIAKIDQDHWAFAPHIYNDPQNAKELVVLWQEGKVGQPLLGNIMISHSHDAGASFD